MQSYATGVKTVSYQKFQASVVQVSISNKDILKLAAPISVSLLIPQVNFLTNTVFLGRLGERELGVNGLLGIFYLIFTMIGSGLASGIQVQMARRAGEKNYAGLARTFTNGMMLCLLFSIVLLALALGIAPLIFSNLHDSTNMQMGLQFLQVRIWGLPFLMLTQLANAFYIATGHSRYLVHGAVVSTAVNILLDYGLIFGKLGMPAMGLMGAAVASVISEVAFCVVMFGIFWLRRMRNDFPILSTWRFDVQLAKKSLMVASPVIGQYLFSIGAWQVFFIYVEHLGTRELAVSQILRSVFGVAGIGLWAFASAANTMVSNVMGQGKQRLVIPVIWRIMRLALIYAAILAALLVIFPAEFLSLYRDEPGLVQFAIPSLRIVASTSIIMAVATVMFNGVLGTGNTRINLIIEIICVTNYIIYCQVVIEYLRMPLAWAWASELVYWGTLVLASGWYLRSKKWKGKVI